MSIIEVVEKFVKMWYNAFAYERQIGIDGGSKHGNLSVGRFFMVYLAGCMSYISFCVTKFMLHGL